MTFANTPQIPGIEILGELGRGAHSVVYRARLGSIPCAVKLPRAKARWTKWIYREAVALARVRHPGLPTVLDVGEVDELPYLVMELVEGETLADRLTTHPPTEEMSIDIARQLLSVLGAVHDAGLVHRDVKPRNIIVDSVNKVLKLVDFGFATPIEHAGRDETAGTVAYAAPEQLVMPGRVDGRADLFALGRVLFECLTHKSAADRHGPFGANARAELIAAGVSPTLSDIVANLLERLSDDRYPDARAVEMELDRLAGGVAARGPKAYSTKRDAKPAAARDLELASLREISRALRREGNKSDAGGAMVLVRGVRGSGKTRFVAAAATEFRAERFQVLEVAAQRDDEPLATLRRIFDAHLDEAPRATISVVPAPEVVLQVAAGELGPVASLVAPRLRGIMGPEVSTLGADTVPEAAAEILVRLAKQRGPLVLVVDDAQWMDPTSTDALLRVAFRVGEAPVVLVLAARVSPAGLSPATNAILDRFAVASGSRSSVIELKHLDEAQVGMIIHDHLRAPCDEPVLVRRIHAMADGTPLGVLEVLGAFLDSGALRPNERSWTFDVARADQVTLPVGALALLGRRLDDLPLATQRVLETAAIIGRNFDNDLLARVVELTVDDLDYAIVAALRAGLIERVDRLEHRFVHDSLPEILTERLDHEARRALHQRIGEVLKASGEQSVATICATALHFAAGVIEKNPIQAYQAASAAMHAVLDRFDNDQALLFFGHAQNAAALASRELDVEDLRVAGEAHLRLGALDESKAVFEKALSRARDRTSRAAILGRIAWVLQASADPEKAWTAIEQAFSELGSKMPIESASSAMSTTLTFVGSRAFRRTRRRERNRPLGEIELLCQLHYQNARLGLEYGKPMRLLQSSIEAFEWTKQNISPRARARALTLYGFVLTAIRLRAQGEKELANAQQIATEQGDSATAAFCVQVRSTAAGWVGDFSRLIELARECIDVYGPWLELSEFCLNIANADLIESVRGRSNHAWQWMERGLERLRRSPTRPVVVGHLLHRARATMATRGMTAMDGSGGAWLSTQLAAVPVTDAGHGYHRVLSWGPRVRYYVERGDLGEEFEALTHAFDAEKYDPASAHPVLGEYYVAIMHARMHQCFRATNGERAKYVLLFRQALATLTKAAKMPIIHAHRIWGEGTLAWLDGNTPKAKKLLDEAVELADQHTCPLVLYGVARTRAHMLRAAGLGDSARDQARVAEALAIEHGAVHRTTFIREEFALPTPIVVDLSATLSLTSRSSSRTSRQLSALLQVVRAPRRDLRTEDQAGVILTELIQVLEADRSAILFLPESQPKPITLQRRRDVATPEKDLDEARRSLLRHVHDVAIGWPTAGSDHWRGQLDPTRVLAVPLFLYEKPVGALLVERAASGARFAADDGGLLALLSHQVPIALEIARLLSEREQLHTSLQHAKKMEAMGALAGGLAHDFNNMLAAMRVALNSAQERAALDAELTFELDIIAEATTRAAQLTSQLLSFSRHQPVPVAVHDVNQLISNLEPMLRRVVGSNVDMRVNLSPAVDAVEVDQGSFDQALVNLLINARDAMPNGGKLIVKTRNVIMNDAAAQRANLSAGEYVEVEVSDSGEGMSAETLTRIFEPFYTTKPVGKGSGLGLAMVYAFTRNCGGSIDVSSELGRGTQFRLYLKRVARPRARKVLTSMPSFPAPKNGNGTRGISKPPSSPGIKVDSPDIILVVDDDDLVRRSISKILERNGYRVLSASGSAEALDFAREHGAHIALVILDILMPGLTGPELGRKLFALNLPAKMLFVSGFSPESIPIEQAQVAADMLLQKPFSQTTLLERVRQLMRRDVS